MPRRKKVLIVIAVVVASLLVTVGAYAIHEAMLFAQLSAQEKTTIGVWGWNTIDATGRMRIRPNHRWDIWFIESERDEYFPKARLVTHGYWKIEGKQFIYVNDPGQLEGLLPVKENHIPLSDFGSGMKKVRCHLTRRCSERLFRYAFTICDD
jgi:hypothetical protein